MLPPQHKGGEAIEVARMAQRVWRFGRLRHADPVVPPDVEPDPRRADQGRRPSRRQRGSARQLGAKAYPPFGASAIGQ
jgi:hypothetical protein